MKGQHPERFEAEIMFLDPCDPFHGIRALAAAGCKFEYYPDAIDEWGPTVFGMVTGTTELDEDALPDWLMSIIDQFSGDVLEWGLVRLTEERRRNRRRNALH
jgi:hypothetical protein